MQQHEYIYQNINIISLNCIVDVRSSIAFKIFVANYVNGIYHFNENQTVARLLPKPGAVTPPNINLLAVLELIQYP